MDLLSCTVQNYDWGDRDAISALQQRPPSGSPEAELWMGSHPRASSVLPSGMALHAAIEADPVAMLGEATAQRFGQLPFLFKVLAASRPLSVQSHPTLQQAIEGFDRENQAGIPLDATNRTYRDPSHKPELIAALTHFEAKCGFRALDSARDLFDQLPGSGLDPVRSILNETGTASDIYSRVLTFLLSAPEEARAGVASATVQASGSVAAGSPFAAELAWSAPIAGFFPNDVGVTVALLLNHVVLEPGQAIFLGAGNLHAYLRGVGMELMANSDNVVRGGLTPKHVDVPELLRVVECTPLDAPVQTPSSGNWTYESPVPEFALDRLVGGRDADPPGEALSTEGGPQILFFQAAAGAAIEMQGAGHPLPTPQGSVVWMSGSDSSYEIHGEHTVWRSRVGADVQFTG